MVSVEEALRLLVENVRPLGHETVLLKDAAKRVLAEDISADRNSPPWRKSMMDGFAVRSSDINAGTQKLKVIETITAGEAPSVAVEAGQATRIMTGAPVPEGADAIVMIERCSFEEGSTRVTIELDSIDAGKHLMRRERISAKGIKSFRRAERSGHWTLYCLPKLVPQKSKSFKSQPSQFFRRATNSLRQTKTHPAHRSETVTGR